MLSQKTKEQIENLTYVIVFGLGVVLITLGIVSILVGSFLVVFRCVGYQLGTPIWTGVIFIITGIYACTMRGMKHKTKHIMTVYSLSITSVVMSIITGLHGWYAATQEYYSNHCIEEFQRPYVSDIKCMSETARISVDISVVIVAMLVLGTAIAVIVMTYYMMKREHNKERERPNRSEALLGSRSGRTARSKERLALSGESTVDPDDIAYSSTLTAEEKHNSKLRHRTSQNQSSSKPSHNSTEPCDGSEEPNHVNNDSLNQLGKHLVCMDEQQEDEQLEMKLLGNAPAQNIDTDVCSSPASTSSDPNLSHCDIRREVAEPLEFDPEVKATNSSLDNSNHSFHFHASDDMMNATLQAMEQSSNTFDLDEETTIDDPVTPFVHHSKSVGLDEETVEVIEPPTLAIRQHNAATFDQETVESIEDHLNQSANVQQFPPPPVGFDDGMSKPPDSKHSDYVLEPNNVFESSFSSSGVSSEYSDIESPVQQSSMRRLQRNPNGEAYGRGKICEDVIKRNKETPRDTKPTEFVVGQVEVRNLPSLSSSDEDIRQTSSRNNSPKRNGYHNNKPRVQTELNPNPLNGQSTRENGSDHVSNRSNGFLSNGSQPEQVQDPTITDVGSEYYPQEQTGIPDLLDCPPLQRPSKQDNAYPMLQASPLHASLPRVDNYSPRRSWISSQGSLSDVPVQYTTLPRDNFAAKKSWLSSHGSLSEVPDPNAGLAHDYPRKSWLSSHGSLSEVPDPNAGLAHDNPRKSWVSSQGSLLSVPDQYPSLPRDRYSPRRSWISSQGSLSSIPDNQSTLSYPKHNEMDEQLFDRERSTGASVVPHIDTSLRPPARPTEYFGLMYAGKRV